jgi:hypothetical protein
MPAAIIEFVDVTVNVGGVTADKFAFGVPMGVFSHTVTTNRQDGPYFSLAEVVAAGFTSVATPTIYAWASAVFAQDDGVDSVLIGRIDAADANYTVTMNAIEAAGADTWYITNIESRADADIADVAAWTESRDKIAIFQSDDATLVAALALQAFGYNRSALIYHDDDSEYLDGAWTSSGGGLNLDTPGGVGIWAYRALEGVPFDDVTGALASSIYAADANLYGRNKGLSFTSKGTMASGRFIDVTTTVDWVKLRTEEAVLETFVNAGTKIPYTNAGISIIVGTVQGVLDQGVSFGHFSGDAPPTVTAPDVSEVSTADKTNRVLQLTAQATLAGAIQKLELTINLAF